MPMFTVTTATSANKCYSGVYSEAEQKMLDEARKHSVSMQFGLQGGSADLGWREDGTDSNLRDTHPEGKVTVT